MESEIDNDTKDLDLFENLVEVAEHTSAAPENGCPYTLYHMDIERNQNECRAHKFEKAILSPLNSTQLVGLPRPTTVPPLQRALMIINALMYYTISGLTRESTSKVPLKISPLDQNITYITDIEVLSKFYLKSMSELFGNVFPTKVYVTSTSIKEYEHNRKVISFLNKEKSYINKEVGMRARTTLYLPAYVVILHLVNSKKYIDILNREGLRYTKEEVADMDIFIKNLLQRAQFKHYMTRLKSIKAMEPKIVCDDTIFRNCMCDYNYYKQQ